MKKTTSVWLAIVLSGLIGGAQAETLRFGMDGNYPPFTRQGPDGNLQGFDVDIAVKIFAFILLAIGAVALSYGNAPAKRIQSCEKMGVGQAVCAAAEWDSEKLNVLPRYNPSLNKVIAAAQLAPAARQQDNNSVVRA